VVEVGHGAVVGTFAGIQPGSTALMADPAGRRALFTTRASDYFGDWVLKAHDPGTFLPLGSEVLPGVSEAPRDLVRWGARGIAFRAANPYGAAGANVYFLETELAAP
jgi:hypothetical protein